VIKVTGPDSWERSDRLSEALSYDDVLLVPQYSEIESRSEVNIAGNLSDSISLDLPIIASPMDTVTHLEMMEAMSDSGGLAILHRYNSVEEQTEVIQESVVKGVNYPAAAIGATGDYMFRANSLVGAGAKILCLDVAHGHHIIVKKALMALKSLFNDDVHIMAGNIATLKGLNDLADWGADSVRLGIGGGSICSTRLVSGSGLPTFQSIVDCARTHHDVKIIADGSIKRAGDIVKALAAGADFVMAGSLFAGTDESPGKTFTNQSGKKYKVYQGMASSEAQYAWRGKSTTPEGISTTVPYKGSVISVLNDLAGGIRSGLSYTGARDLAELTAKAKFVKQTSAGQHESFTHILARNK